MNKKKVTIIDEPYTCMYCGRMNLKYGEITYKEDIDGQVIESSVSCHACFFRTSPRLQALMRKHPEAAEELAKEFEKIAKQMEYNYNRRMARRVLKKEGGDSS